MTAADRHKEIESLARIAWQIDRTLTLGGSRFRRSWDEYAQLAREQVDMRSPRRTSRKPKTSASPEARSGKGSPAI